MKIINFITSYIDSTLLHISNKNLYVVSKYDMLAFYSSIENKSLHNTLNKKKQEQQHPYEHTENASRYKFCAFHTNIFLYTWSEYKVIACIFIFNIIRYIYFMCGYVKTYFATTDAALCLMCYNLQHTHFPPPLWNVLKRLSFKKFMIFLKWQTTIHTHTIPLWLFTTLRIKLLLLLLNLCRWNLGVRVWVKVCHVKKDHVK